MKKLTSLILFACTLNTYAHTGSDTLPKKRINFAFGANTLLPNYGGYNNYWGINMPNSNIYPAKTRSIYYTTVNKPSFSITTSVYVNIIKNLYAETGLNVSVYNYTNYLNGDSLFNHNGTFISMSKTTGNYITTSATLGLAYKFGKYVLLSAGAYINMAGREHWQSNYYYQNNLVTSSSSVDAGVHNLATKYAYATILVNPHVAANLGITKGEWDEKNLYYSFGLKYFLYKI